MTPDLRQRWIAQECATLPPQTVQERGAVLMHAAAVERRSVVGLLLSLRQDIPVSVALDLLTAAPLDLNGTAGTAWVGAVTYPDEAEIIQ